MSSSATASLRRAAAGSSPSTGHWRFSHCVPPEPRFSRRSTFAEPRWRRAPPREDRANRRTRPAGARAREAGPRAAVASRRGSSEHLGLDLAGAAALLEQALELGNVIVPFDQGGDPPETSLWTRRIR